MPSSSINIPSLNNPLDVLETIIYNNAWPYEREGNVEIVTAVAGEMSDFHIRYEWMEDQKIVKISAMIDLQVSDENRPATLEALNMINGRLSAGNFAIWQEGEFISVTETHRLGTYQADNTNAFEEITLSLISLCNEYFPMLKQVITHHKSPLAALHYTLLECVGEA